MNTNIKRLLDPRQQTKQNTTSNNVKEIEMKTRTISKKAILGLAIGTGLIAGFSLISSGSETRAFNPAEAGKTVNAGMVFDESQEAVNYPVSNLASSQGMVIDESQEAGNYPVSKLASSQGMVIDESQEAGNYPVSKLASSQGMVIDESQESGGYPTAKVSLPHELAFDESQENGGNFTDAPLTMVIDESQEVGGV
jgi:hypothetical protein